MPSTYSGPRLPSELFRELDCQFSLRSSGPKRLQPHPPAHKDHRESAAHDQRRQRLSASPSARRSGKGVSKRERPFDKPGLNSGKVVQLEKKSNSSSTARTNTTDVISKGEYSLHEPCISSNAALKTSSRDKKADREDADIAILERRLGINTTRLPKAFEEDGLGDLLGNLDHDLNETKKRRRNEDYEWLQQKRRRSSRLDDWQTDGSNSLVDTAVDSQDDLSNLWLPADASISHSEPSDNEENGWESADAVDLESELSDRGLTHDTKKAPGNQGKTQSLAVYHKENPYTAPHQDDSSATAKYVPPYLRKRIQGEDASVRIIRRRVKGLFNRLSDANVISILAEIEQIYQSCPRQQVTDIITDLLLGVLCDSAPLSDNFIITHAGIIAAVYKIIGTEFGAHVLERIVEAFDAQYSLANQSSMDADGQAASSNRSKNMCSTLCQLCNLQVISSTILFDYVRFFLPTLSELNSELLWVIMKLSGAQLRADDVSSLKHIASVLQKNVTEEGPANFSVRTKFIIDNINDLKNNRLKAGSSGRALATEHVQQMRRVLYQLKDRPDYKSVEPLRVALADIRDKEKKGKWWLIGSSWKGKDCAPTYSKGLLRKNDQLALDDTTAGDREVSLDALAKSAGMNTTVRRAIFIALVSATDFVEAQRQLSKLALKRSQQPEVARVLLHCASAEPYYNPYYTLIAKKLCSSSIMKIDFDNESGSHNENGKMQKAFQFALWNLIGHLEDADHNNTQSGGQDDNLSLSAIVNQARLYGELIADGILPITVLRKFDMAMLNSRSSTFVESLLLTTMKVIDEHARTSLRSVFSKALADHRLTMGIRWFMENVITASDLAKTEKRRKVVRRQCKQVRSILADSNSNTAISID